MGIGIGRPQAWGLGAFGQAGVEAVIDIYKRELHPVMQQAGTPNDCRDHRAITWFCAAVALRSD